MNGDISCFAALPSNPALDFMHQAQGCNANWSALLGAALFLSFMGRREWLLQRMQAVKEQLGGLKPTIVLAKKSRWFCSEFHSSDSSQCSGWVARDWAQKGICTQLQARLFGHGHRGQHMDGNNWLWVGTGFAGTAVEDVRSVCLCVLESNATKSSLCFSGCTCW